MSKNETFSVVRSNKIQVGKRYLVEIHGVGAKWMKAKEVAAVPLAQMTEKDRFVFGGLNGKGEDLILQTHGTGGPQFLVARVTGKRGGLVNARVTFHTKSVETAVETKAARKAA